MVDNGNIKQSEFYREMKELRGDISDIKVMLEKYYGAVSVASTERNTLKDALKGLAEWKEETDKRLDLLESKDKRMVAQWGAIGVGIGAVITVIGNILIAIL